MDKKHKLIMVKHFNANEGNNLPFTEPLKLQEGVRVALQRMSTVIEWLPDDQKAEVVNWLEAFMTKVWDAADSGNQSFSKHLGDRPVLEDNQDYLGQTIYKISLAIVFLDRDQRLDALVELKQLQKYLELSESVVKEG